MECPACGADNREGARFCRRCGVEMEKWVPDTAPEARAGEPAPVGEAGPAPEEPPAETEPGTTAAGTLLGGEPEPAEAESEAVAETAVEEPTASEPGEVAAGEEVSGPEPVTEEAAPEEATAEEAAAGEPGLPLAEAAEEALAGEGLRPEDEELPEIDDDLLGFWREEGEPLQPVEAGTLVADRYQVTEALDVQKEAILYEAQDLVRCWQCGFEGNARDDAFCAQCGAAQDRRPQVRLLQVRDGQPELPEGAVVAGQFLHEGQTFLLLAEAEEPELQEPARPTGGIRLLVGYRSDAGQVRELDEDSLVVLTMAPSYEARVGPVLGLFSVADGMGGHEGGEIASKMALQVLGGQAMRHIFIPMMAGELVLDEAVTALLRQATIAANDAVYLARQKRENDMGTTMTTVLVRDERLFVAHVGDCRAYRWNAQGLEQLTTDHSVVASMIAEGRAAPEEIYSHPHRSVIYRCVGDKATVEVDTDMLPLASGDRIVVCSDGLWEMVRNEGIEDVMMQEADPQAACDLLVKNANVAGGEDNISVIVVQVGTI